MAGHWIPWEIGLERKREVLIIARLLGVTRREAAAMCMEVWAWAADQSVDGLIRGFTPEDVSDAVGIQGIGEAMADPSCGWLIVDDSSIQLPNWDRFNSRPAKARMLKAEQNRRHYAKASTSNKRHSVGRTY